MSQLGGKVAVVTGSSTGIGSAAALAFAREGATVVVAARRPSEGAATAALVRAAGGDALYVRTDLTVASEVEALIDWTLDRYGRLDCAFNNAGTSRHRPLRALDESEWDAVLDANLKAVWLCLKHELRAMRDTGGGAVVNMSALDAAGGPYVAASGGVLSLTRAAAAEGVACGVRVNAVVPGTARVWDGVSADTPDAEPAEIAAAVVWLCSDASALVTGQTLPSTGRSWSLG